MRLVAVTGFLGVVFLMACGTGSNRATQSVVNFECPNASGTSYQLSYVDDQQLAKMIADSRLSIRMPPDLMGLRAATASNLKGRRGLVVDVGADDLDRETVAIIFSEPRTPACSGPPSGPTALTTDQGVKIYPFTFSNSITYVARFKPRDSLAVEVMVFWVPYKEPPRRSDQLSVVDKWINAIYNANKK